jgi:RNA recognition motif-containing protein
MPGRARTLSKFKEADMRKMYIGNLPPEATEDTVRNLFAEHGTVRSIRLARDVFSGNCRGFGFVEMEGHEARAAIAALNGKHFMGKELRVNEERVDKDKAGKRGRRRR